MGEWKEYRIEDVCSRITSGSTPSRKRLDYFGGTIPWLSSKEVNFNRIDRTDEHITEAGLRNSSAKWIDPNAVIVAMYGATAGRVALSRIRLTTNQACCNITTDQSKCDFEYLFYFLTSKYEELVQLSTGVAQQNLSLSVLKEFPLLLPSVGEQRAIASVLSSLDAKIDLLHRQNKTLEGMAEALFREWFGEGGGLGGDGGGKEGWEEGTLGEIIDVYDSKRVPLSNLQRAAMQAGKLYPYYGAATIMDQVNDFLFDGEYILLGEDGTVVTEDGYPVLQYATGKFWVNNHAHVLQAKLPYTNRYLWAYLKQQNIADIVTGAVQPKISQGNLKSLPIVLPPREVVESICAAIAPLYAKLDKNIEQIGTLAALRDTLLPKLMSGEVRVEMNKR